MILLLIIGIVFFLLALSYFLYSFWPQPSATLAPIDPERTKCESPIEQWLYDSLKMRGFVVETKVSCGPYEIDIVLPAHQVAIHCQSLTAAEKAFYKQKSRYLKQNGWRIIDIRPHYLYQDFNEKLRKIDVYMHN